LKIEIAQKQQAFFQVKWKRKCNKIAQDQACETR